VRGRKPPEGRARGLGGPPRRQASAFADVDPARSALMARIRSRDTRPELEVRRALHARGLRFRLHRRDLPGTPDIVLPRHRLAILVHGCFWHRHRGCGPLSLPRTRTDYWAQKFAANTKRDRKTAKALAARGWAVEVVWECEARRPDRLAARLDRLVASLPRG
jgi:DNA mismatch endonuclease (patch repair protein)